MKRRTFLHKAGIGTLLAGSGAFPVFSSAADLDRPEIQKLTILHTNDVHSRVEPFPMDGGRYEGLGGAARRTTLIKQVRAEEEQVLLLDSGDIFQGTPYFNFFQGELEFKLMSEMGYDAGTLGNHDFDGGINGLYTQLPNANFPFLVCNYDFSDTLMNGKTKPYKTFQKGAIKVGVFGVGIELEGLVSKELFQETRYLDPIENANRVAAILKQEEQCDFVICLSHLGFEYKDSKVSDKNLAKSSKDIDLILGGHTHTFLEKPIEIANVTGQPILINQVGFGGIYLGRLDVFFEKRRKGFRSRSNSLLVG